MRGTRRLAAILALAGGASVALAGMAGAADPPAVTAAFSVSDFFPYSAANPFEQYLTGAIVVEPGTTTVSMPLLCSGPDLTLTGVVGWNANGVRVTPWEYLVPDDDPLHDRIAFDPATATMTIDVAGLDPDAYAYVEVAVALEGDGQPADVRADLGAYTAEVWAFDPDELAAYGIPSGQPGAVVWRVLAGSAAAAAGLTAGDVVTAAAGSPVDDGEELDEIVAAKAPGDAIALTVVRRGQTLTVPVTLHGRPVHDAVFAFDVYVPGSYDEEDYAQATPMAPPGCPSAAVGPGWRLYASDDGEDTSATTAGAGGLPDTGASSSGLLAGGLALVALGSLVLIAARRSAPVRITPRRG